MSREREIKRWTATLSNAVRELRALGVEPNIPPPPWMQEAEAYLAMTAGRYRREREGGSSDYTQEERAERDRILRSMIDHVGVHKAGEIMEKEANKAIEDHLILKYGGGSK